MSSPYFHTWKAQRGAVPMDLEGGEGVWLRGRSGETWLDLGSLSYQAHLGLGHPTMKRAIAAQLDTLALAPPNADFPGKRELADELLALAPTGFDRVFFTSGGAESVENALKIARLVTGRHKTVSRYRSYHGATLGALSVTGDWRRPPLEPLLGGATRILDCYCDRCPFGKTADLCQRECGTQLDEVLALEGNVGAAIFEPVPGANGVLVPPPGYWTALREACDRHGALLIADEVLTGFGRTGKALAIEHFDVVPDLITLAKGISAGYAPLGAVLVHERVSAHFDDRVLMAGLTTYGHPLSIAAGRAALSVYQGESLFERAAALGPALRAGLDRIAGLAGERAPFVRSLGLLGAVELDLDDGARKRLSRELARARVLLHYYPDRGLLVLAPALNIGETDLSEGLDRVCTAVEEALS